MDWKWIRVEEVDGFDPLDLQITFLSRHLTFCSDTFSLVRFWPPKCQQTPVDTIKVREFQLIFKEFVISDYDMKSFLTFDTKQQTTDWQRLFVPNPDISNSYDVDKLIWLMMVFFTYLHEVLQAKFSHDGFFTNKTSCPFLTSRRFVRIPWPTNQDLTWSTNATNINNVWSFFLLCITYICFRLCMPGRGTFGLWCQR